MNLLESLGDLLLRCVAAGKADITTVSTLFKFAQGADYFAAQIEKAPDDPPSATSAAMLTAAAVLATQIEAGLPDQPADPPSTPISDSPQASLQP